MTGSFADSIDIDDSDDWIFDDDDKEAEEYIQIGDSELEVREDEQGKG